MRTDLGLPAGLPPLPSPPLPCPAWPQHACCSPDALRFFNLLPAGEWGTFRTLPDYEAYVAEAARRLRPQVQSHHTQRDATHQPATLRDS